MRTLKFEELNLDSNVLKGLNDNQKTEATELQQTILPAYLDGKDAFIKTDDIQGKVEVISITALDSFCKKPEADGTRILILTPNAKGAHHIVAQVTELGSHTDVSTAAIDEGGDRGVQEEALKSGTPVLVANPDRLLNLLQDNLFILRDLHFLVVDGLDEMIEMGHEEQVKRIRKRIVSENQKLLFTNQLNEQVKGLASHFLDQPELIGFEHLGSNGENLEGPPSVPSDLSQGYINVPPRMKISTLMAHLENTPDDNCVIFTASKRGTDRLYRILRKNNKKATSLHGKLSDEKHSQRFANFTNGDVQYLLVTDISARDLNLDRVTQVINYDVPNDPEEYKYRANLVGSGKASRIVSLVSKQDQNDIRQLENELGQAPQELPLPDKVKQKLKERKKGGGGKKSRGGKERPKQGKKQKKEENKMELPRPSYDKLSGGRKGDQEDERTGVVEFFRKLFS